jgi:hypothetical protein
MHARRLRGKHAALESPSNGQAGKRDGSTHTTAKGPSMMLPTMTALSAVGDKYTCRMHTQWHTPKKQNQPCANAHCRTHTRALVKGRMPAAHADDTRFEKPAVARKREGLALRTRTANATQTEKHHHFKTTVHFPSPPTRLQCAPPGGGGGRTERRITWVPFCAKWFPCAISEPSNTSMAALPFLNLRSGARGKNQTGWGGG